MIISLLIVAVFVTGLLQITHQSCEQKRRYFFNPKTGGTETTKASNAKARLKRLSLFGKNIYLFYFTDGGDHARSIDLEPLAITAYKLDPDAPIQTTETNKTNETNCKKTQPQKKQELNNGEKIY